MKTESAKTSRINKWLISGTMGIKDGIIATIGNIVVDEKPYYSINLKRENVKYGFTIGIERAKLILESLEAIKKFVEDYSEAK